ncbi:MAG TPA: primosomal protein N' [Aestuariivirgaceae bacterium]|nr:primosomal protein N' [Aestuariivirgaceae bacterium]
MTKPQTTIHVLLPLALPGPYSYLLPEGLGAQPGSYVIAPLGSQELIGVVWPQSASAAPEGKLRPILEVIDEAPMPELHRQFIDWVAKYYLASPGMVLRMTLRVPAALGPMHGRTAFRASGTAPAKLTAQRRRVLDLLADGVPLSQRDLTELAGVGASVVKGLVREGVLEEVVLPAFPRFPEPDPDAAGIALTAVQEEAARGLVARVAAGGHSVTALEGVTGSGKTEVYFEAMAKALAEGRQVLLLVPEIALTAQFIERVERRFGARPGEWHSDVRPRERERLWRGVASGQARIVVGARSALFLPWTALGLIVVDEEHEPAFKQEDGVTYHARDMAIVYGALGGFPVILSSATPSLETLVNVDRGRYGRVALPDRIGRAGLPDIGLVDMRDAAPPNGRWLSEPVARSVTETLEKGEQALLFLNRRGYAPLTLCRACGHRIECPNCSASLVEHRFRKVMLCHHCGHQEPALNSCPACGAEGQLVPCGPGIERLAEEVRQRFPEARVALLSSDLQRGNTLKETLREVAEGKHNLIIGTQLVAKGHHFPELTLAGIVDADLALETGDPRAGERTYQLLAQVSGRAGRGDRPGRALVQTFNPDHPLMQALASGDTAGFLAQEKAMRETAELPPFSRLAAIIVSGGEAPATERLARQVASLAPAGDGISVLGPAPAPLALIRGRHRWRLLVRARRDVNIQAFLQAWLGHAKPKGSLRIDIDIDPYTFL